LTDKDFLGLLNSFTELIGSEGYDSFCHAVLKTFVLLGRGKSGFLITATRRGFREEFSFLNQESGEPEPGVRRKKISFPKSSKLMHHLSANRQSLTVRRNIKDEKLTQDCTLLEEYESWTIVPIYLGEYFAGFILIGNQPKRPKMEVEELLMLGRLASFHIATRVMENKSDERIDKLSSENDKLMSLLELYDYSIMSRFSLTEIFSNIAGRFDISAGAVVAGWAGGGTPELLAAVGLSERGCSRYKVSKSDRGIRAILREGAPAMVEDVEKRLDTFLKEDRENVNTYAVAPIQFKGQTLGLVIIHSMKGVSKKLTNTVRKKLSHIAQSLIPFLLYNRMTNLEPFEVFESLIEREAAKARRKRSSLHVVAFRVKNFKAIIKEKGFNRYRGLLDRFTRQIRNEIGQCGVVHILSLNKVVLLLIKKEADDATRLINDVKRSVSELLNKEREKLPLSISPFRTSYPNESRSVSEIIQLIE
jgi:GGDEF domain-containing protein